MGNSRIETMTNLSTSDAVCSRAASAGSTQADQVAFKGLVDTVKAGKPLTNAQLAKADELTDKATAESMPTDDARRVKDARHGPDRAERSQGQRFRAAVATAAVATAKNDPVVAAGVAQAHQRGWPMTATPRPGSVNAAIVTTVATSRRWADGLRMTSTQN